MKKIALYARVSTSTGKQNTEVQLQKLREYCKQRDLVIYKEYIDELSGTREDRPNFQLMMDAARKRKFDGVLVFRFDRFARSVKVLVTALEEFQQLGIDFISYCENIDTSSALGRLMFTVISGFNAMELEIQKERIHAGLSKARNSGKTLGAPRKAFDTARAIQLNTEGWGCRRIGKALGVSHGTVFNYLKSVKESPLQKSPISV